MGKINIPTSILLTELRRIENTKGDVMHAMKTGEPGYCDFGEAYFTTIIPGAVKGWKKHEKMTMNIIVPYGMVRFYIHDELNGKTLIHDIGELNYVRLTIPKGYWVAFQGLTNHNNLILNIANIEHDPTEAMNAPLEDYPLFT